MAMMALGRQRRLQEVIAWSSRRRATSTFYLSSSSSSSGHHDNNAADSTLSSPPVHAAPIWHDTWSRLQQRYQERAVVVSNNAKKGSSQPEQPLSVFPLLTPEQEVQLELRHREWKKDAKAAAQKQQQQQQQQQERQNAAAAVLVLLCSIHNTPCLLFTRRAAHLNSHASELSFVGGHFDPIAGDRSLVDAALREAQEELLPADNNYGFNHANKNIHVFGQTTPLPSLRGTPVTPVLAVLWPELIMSSDNKDNTTTSVTQLFPGDPSEVDLVFAVSIADLIQNESSRRLSKFRRLGLTPVFGTPHGEIWGLTAYILRPILHQLLRPVFGSNHDEAR